MALSRDVEAGIDGVLAPEWNVRTGHVVPEAENIVLRDGAVRLDATFLYADMADSTGLAQSYYDWAVAKVIRCYLNAASRLIRARGGAIRSFDGDRVMGIFVGAGANDLAVKAAMNIHWAVRSVIQPKLEAKWDSFKWTMEHGIGIDSGEALLVRGGVFGNNDLVSVGSAPNIAAKLSDERVPNKYLFVSETVYNSLSDVTKYAEGVNMWSSTGVKGFGGKYIKTFGTNYSWEP
jgi:class 3 adenylate cyclase